MELTVLNKKRYDELMSSIKNLETQVAMAHSQLRAMQDSNNQLAEIAFDENKFTQELMDKVWETAERAAKEEIDGIDTEDIAREVSQYVDISEDVERAVERLDYATKDDVNDLISDYINNEDLTTESEVEQLIADYVDQNCDYVEKDVTDTLHDDIQELKEEMRALKGDIVLEVLQLIANKLTGKDTHHANNNRDHGLYISGTLTQGETASDGTLSA